ncbi:MAG: peptidylprolyl isomerase [Halanaerobiales bacterium]
MKYKRIAVILLVIVLLASTGVLAQDQDVSEEEENKEVAVINDESITLNQLEQFAQTQQLVMQISQVDQSFAQLLFSSDEGQNLLDEYRKVKLEDLINQELLRQKAEESDVEVSEEEEDQYFNQQVEQIKEQNDLSQSEFEEVLEEQGTSMEEYKEQFLENSQILVDKFLQDEVFSDINITESEAKSYYEDNKSEFEQKEQVEVSHILLNDEQKADEIKSQLEEGADFEQLAKENSVDNNTAEEGGKLGYIEKGQVVPEFETVAFQTEEGEISEVFESQQGYHIIKVHDKKEAKTLSFSEVEDQINDTLSEQKRQEEMQEYINKLRDEFDVEVKI